MDFHEATVILLDQFALIPECSPFLLRSLCITSSQPQSLPSHQEPSTVKGKKKTEKAKCPCGYSSEC